MVTWCENFRYMFRLASCLFVWIVMVIAFYISRLCTIKSLDILILLYSSNFFFGKFNLYATNKDQNKNKNKKLNFQCHRKYSLPLKSTPQYFDQKKIVFLYPQEQGTKKIFPLAAAKKKLFINLIELLKKSLHYETTLTELFLVKKQGAGKKRKFVLINLLMEIFLFVCMFFWNKKYIFSYTFDLCGRVGDKKKFTQPISGNKITFFCLIY